MAKRKKMRVPASATSYLPDLLGLAPGERVVGFVRGKLTDAEIAEMKVKRETAVMNLDYRPPTREELLRHLRVYPASRQDVEEVAAMYGIDLGAEIRATAVKAASVKVERTDEAGKPLTDENGIALTDRVVSKRLARKAGVSKHRHTNAQLVADVMALRSRGMVESAIADALNLADLRVRAIIRGAKVTAGNQELDDEGTLR